MRILSIILVIISILYLVLISFKSLPWVGIIVALSWGFYNLVRKKINVDTDVGLFIESLYILPFALFGFGLISFLFKQNVPGFAEMSIPVIIYASVIMLMVVAAIGRYGKVNPASFKWVLIGALSFMISDTVIALSRFTLVFEDNMSFARLIIMPLYVVGQYLIVKGCALQDKELT